MTDVVIVGGGVIGLAIAYRLAREGVAATVFDRREVGREASWAGAGLIPANTERLRSNPTVELRSWSAVLFPEWSQLLRDETGLDCGYRRTGGIDVAFSADEEQALRASAGRWRNEGIVFERLARADYARVEPALSSEVDAAYFLPDRAQVRSPRLLRALVVAAMNRRAILLPDAPVVGFEVRGNRITAVKSTKGTVACEKVVIAAGAWTGGLLDGLGLFVPTPPVKGEIVLLRSDRPLLRRIVEHGKNYLVPRDDGRVLIGATEEEVGFDTRPTPRGVRDLLDEALRLCPVLAEAEVERSWAGLRPGSVDTRPYIGLIPGFDNAFVASGHKRAGIQLAPATAEAVSDLVLGRAPRMNLADFRIEREPAKGEEETFRS
jgi:glycine oxidase